MLSGICRVKFGHFFPPSLTRVARSGGQKKVPEFFTVYTTWRAELFALYILLRGVPNPVCRRTLLFYRGAVGWGRGRDRGPNPRKADQLENVKYCVWWRRKLCLTMSWTKCSKNWPRPRPFKPWFATFWSLQSRRPQRAGFWSRYSQKIRAKAAFKTDENDKKQSPRRAGEVRPFSHADSGGFIFSRGTPLSSLICRTFLYAAADYRISWNELEIPLKNNCLWLCRGLWSRTLVFDRCRCLFAAFQYYLNAMDDISEKTVLLHGPHRPRYVVWNLFYQRKMPSYYLPFGMSCSTKNLSASWRPFYVSFLMSPSMDSDAPENTKLVIIIVQGERPLFVPQPIRQQPCPHLQRLLWVFNPLDFDH